MGFSIRNPKSAILSEGIEAGDLLPEYQRVDVVRALVGLYRLEVAHVPDYGEFKTDAVCPQDVTRKPRDIQGHSHVVALGERGLSEVQLPGVLEPAQLQCEKLSLGDLRQHMYQLLLHELKSSDGSVELNPRLGVIEGCVVAGHCRPQPAPRNSVAGLVEAHQGRFQSAGLGQQVFLRNGAVLEDELRSNRRAQGHLVLDLGRSEAPGSPLHKETAHLIVYLRPDNRNIGDRAVG